MHKVAICRGLSGCGVLEKGHDLVVENTAELLRNITPDRLMLTRSAAFTLPSLGLTVAELLDIIRHHAEDFVRDQKTGHYVSRAGNYRIVWTRVADQKITVISVIRHSDLEAALR